MQQCVNLKDFADLMVELSQFQDVISIALWLKTNTTTRLQVHDIGPLLRPPILAMMLLRRAPSAQRAVSSPAAVSSSYMALSAYFRRQAALEPQISLNALKLSRRNLHWTPSPDSPKRPASTTSKPTNHQESPSKHPTGTSPRQDLAQQSTEEVLAHLSNFPSSLRRLALSLPSSSLRRPTKDEYVILTLTAQSRLIEYISPRLLSSTSSFLERLKIRFKWFTIRGFRRFRADDWSAFASWIVGGVGIWIIVGT